MTSSYNHLQGRSIDTVLSLSFHIFHARDVLVGFLLFSNIDGMYIHGSYPWSITSRCMQESINISRPGFLEKCLFLSSNTLYVTLERWPFMETVWKLLESTYSFVLLT